MNIPVRIGPMLPHLPSFLEHLRREIHFATPGAPVQHLTGMQRPAGTFTFGNSSRPFGRASISVR
jgi:hypothetical protein